MRYKTEYEPHSPYGHMVELLRSHATPGLVIDLGCGHAAIAEVLVGHGFPYVGVDVDAEALGALRERGLEAHAVDLGDPDRIGDALRRVAAGRQVAAIIALDVVEHLTRPDDTLAALRAVMPDLGARWLGVSIPNVAHFDLAAKLLAGRWDVTRTGLLDDTHVSLFTAERVERSMTAAGFALVGARDVQLRHSDQYFPPMLPSLSWATTLGDFLRVVRDGADEYATTNQFVRLYELAEPRPADEPAARPAFTVIVRTLGTRATLGDTLTCLAAQTFDDLEVVVVVDTTDDAAAARVQRVVDSFDPEFSRKVRVDRQATGNRAAALNRGVELARGRHIVALDDDDVVFAHWLENFRDGAEQRPGAVVRCGCVVQHVRRCEGGVADLAPLSGFEIVYQPEFDFVTHLVTSHSPIHATAFPADAFSALGLRYDTTIEVCEDLSVLLPAAEWCGVVDTGVHTAVYRKWDDAESSEHAIPADTWSRAQRQILERLDERPMLVPRGSATRLHHLVLQLAEMEPRLHAAEAKVEAFERSRVWRATSPVRALLQHPLVRRAGRRIAMLRRR